MNAPDVIRGLAPSRRQLLRRDIGRYRHGAMATPWSEFDWRCFRAADRLDLAKDRRDLIASANARDARPIIDDDGFERDEWLRRTAIATSIYHGGE